MDVMTAPADGFSPKEVAAMAGVTEKAVRNEIHDGIAEPARSRRGKAIRRRFGARDVYYFTLLRRLPLRLSPEDRRDLYRLIVDRLPAAGRWRKVPHGYNLDDMVTIATGPVTSEFRAAFASYRHGRHRVERRPDVNGGELVFRGTRIGVRHIGEMARAGEVDEILADYPALSVKDIAYARLVAATKPGPGRPPRRLEFRCGPG